MKPIIRAAVKADMPDVHKLIVELAVFENEPNAVEVTIADLVADGFSTPSKFSCFVAEINASIVGVALVYYRYSTWKGQVLHLEDLIVSKPYRGHNIGSKLLNRVVEYAAEKKVKRISWEVLDWNAPAIAFYQSKGAVVMRDWNVVQLDQDGISNYINNLKNEGF